MVTTNSKAFPNAGGYYNGGWGGKAKMEEERSY
jgi:hypothetical protein